MGVVGIQDTSAYQQPSFVLFLVPPRFHHELHVPLERPHRLPRASRAHTARARRELGAPREDGPTRTERQRCEAPRVGDMRVRLEHAPSTC